MDKDKIENKVKKEVEKEVKEIEKQVKKEVEKEVKKRFSKKMLEKTVSSALKFKETTVSSAVKIKNEFREQIVIAVTAAFAFLIALSWRTPIQNSVDSIIFKLGLTGKAVYIEYLSALVITLIAALFLMIISSWKSKE